MFRRRTFRRASRTQRVPRPLTDAITLRRVSDVGTDTLVAGGSGSSYGGSQSIQFSLLATADLQSLFEKYRILKVTTVFTPRLDPGNSGLANNSQLTICCACDEEGTTTAPVLMSDPGSFANHKIGTLVAGKSFYYTYTPKVINSVNISGAATAVGAYGRNPWLLCNSQGVTVPHQRLRYFIYTPNTTITPSVDWYHIIHFQVAGIS